MARPHPLRRLMKTPLPTLTEQRLKLFRPSRRQVNNTYNLLNRYIFKNQLKRPPMYIGPWKNIWGMCVGGYYPTRRGTKCWIKLSDKYFCIQWFITIIAHEMVHQYEWDILNKSMTHRQSFFLWREQFDFYNIPLRSWYCPDNWFKYQDINKC
jgi:hypothetical protein